MMKRREFVSAAPVVLAPALWTKVAHADTAQPVAGEDYMPVEPRAPIEAPAGKIEVVEFFWYNCPHCAAFEPKLSAWVKQLPKDVAFRRAPVAFREDFAPQQKLYFALEAMGLVEKLHAKVFNAIHVEKHDLSKGPAIADWVAAQGVDKAKFLDQFNSFGVSTKAAKATQLQNAYKLEGVPTLGVAGRFYTDGTIAKGMDQSLKVTEFLVALARRSK